MNASYTPTFVMIIYLAECHQLKKNNNKTILGPNVASDSNKLLWEIADTTGALRVRVAVYPQV